MPRHAFRSFVLSCQPTDQYRSLTRLSGVVTVDDGCSLIGCNGRFVDFANWLLDERTCDGDCSLNWWNRHAAYDMMLVFLFL